MIDYNRSLPGVLQEVALCERNEDEFKLSLLRSLCYVDRHMEDVPSLVPTWEFNVLNNGQPPSELEQDHLRNCCKPLNALAKTSLAPRQVKPRLL